MWFCARGGQGCALERRGSVYIWAGGRGDGLPARARHNCSRSTWYAHSTSVPLNLPELSLTFGELHETQVTCLQLQISTEIAFVGIVGSPG